VVPTDVFACNVWMPLRNSTIFAECNNSLLTHVAKHKSLTFFVGGRQKAGIFSPVAIVLEWCALSQRIIDKLTVSTSGGVGCSVSYKRMVDILNTNSSSLYVFSVALLFSYRRQEFNYLHASNTWLFPQVICLRQSCWSYVALSSVLIA